MPSELRTLAAVRIAIFFGRATPQESVDAKRDRAGNLTTFGYDPLGRLAYTLDPAARLTQYHRDRAGNLTRLIDANSNTTRWEYDAANRVARKIYADESSYSYEYDGMGNLKSRTDAKQVRTTYDYDPANNLIGVSAPGLAPIGFTYDALNRRTEMTDQTGKTTFGYNLASELETIDGPWENDTITLSYDELGRATDRSINNVGADTLVFDDYGRPQSVTNPLGTFAYSYTSPVSTLLETVTPTAGPRTTFTYADALGDYRLSGIWHKDGANQTISRFGYEYDALGQIRKWTQQAGMAPEHAFVLYYDRARQLKGATIDAAGAAPLPSYSYEYDRGGNRVAETIGNEVTKESPNNVNQLITRQGGTGLLPIRGRTDEPASVTVNGRPAVTNADNTFEARIDVIAGSNPVSVTATDAKGNEVTNRYDVVVTGSGTKTLVYDPNGNLTSDGTRTFEWDPLDRLTAVTRGAQRSEFVYNGAGQRARVTEKENGSVTSTKTFISVGAEICEIRDGDNALVQRNYAQGEQRIVNGSAVNYYYGRDHLGSIRVLADESGAVRARYEYDPFGNTTKSAGDLECELGYTGLYRHAPSDLYLALYRAYDSTTGRWISRDPIGETGGLNLYGYVHNRPVGSVDPLGLAEILIAIAPRFLTPEQLADYNARNPGNTMTMEDNAEQNADNASTVRRLVEEFLERNPPGSDDKVTIEETESKGELLDECKQYDRTLIFAHGNDTPGQPYTIAVGPDRVRVDQLPASCTAFGCNPSQGQRGGSEVMRDLLSALGRALGK